MKDLWTLDEAKYRLDLSTQERRWVRQRLYGKEVDQSGDGGARRYQVHDIRTTLDDIRTHPPQRRPPRGVTRSVAPPLDPCPVCGEPVYSRLWVLDRCHACMRRLSGVVQ